jgi:hypothetical protein
MKENLKAIIRQSLYRTPIPTYRAHGPRTYWFEEVTRLNKDYSIKIRATIESKVGGLKETCTIISYSTLYWLMSLEEASISLKKLLGKDTKGI